MLSYLPQPLAWPDSHYRFRRHSNNWESREIARLLASMGYDVDIIDWTDATFIPEKRYDVVIDIHTNLQRLAPFLPDQATKILHCTGSDALFQNRAEMQRVREMESRRGVYYTPKRLVPYPDLAQRSLEIADAASLIGNKETLATYPADLQAKIRLVTVSVPRMDEVIRRPPLLPAGREFLWFGGRGAVHKGLDLVLEAFADVPALALHVAGYVDQEPDFVKAYRRELFDTPNITYHGFMEIGSAAFAKILEKVFCFIAPSCSEGISPAAAVCLQVGLYPILSRHAGVTLPPGCGTYLEDCSVPEIQAAVRRLVLEPADRIESAMRSCQSYALSTYSREAFRRDYAAFLEDVLR